MAISPVSQFSPIPHIQAPLPDNTPKQLKQKIEKKEQQGSQSATTDSQKAENDIAHSGAGSDAIDAENPKVAGEQPGPVRPRRAIASTGSRLSVPVSPEQAAVNAQNAGINKLNESNKKIQELLDGQPTAKDIPASETYSTALDKYWNTPDQYGVSPKDRLVEARKSALSAEAELRAGDETLTPKSKELIDSVVANPTLAQRNNALPSGSRPGVYKIPVKGAGVTPGTTPTLSGAYIITSNDGSKLGDPPPNDTDPVYVTKISGPVILYTPARGFEEFDSIGQLNGELDQRLLDDDFGTTSQGLTQSLPRKVQHSIDRGYEVKTDTRSILSPIKGNYVGEGVQSQLDQQKQNIQFAWNSPSNTDSLQQTVSTLDDAADMHQQLDSSNVLITRDEKLAEKIEKDNEPAWLKNASPADRETYQQLQKEETDHNNDLKPYLEKIPSLHSYSNTKVTEELKQQYPNAEIDPDKVNVTIATTTTSLGGITQSGGKQDVRPETVTVSLTEYAAGNYRKPWEGRLTNLVTTTVTATAPLLDSNGQAVVDSNGNPVVLDKTQLDAIVRKLDIGKKYTDLLKEKLPPNATSDEAKDFKDKWTTANQAKMKKEAFEAKLNPEAPVTFTWNSRDKPYGPKRGLLWIDAVINHPDPSSRPTVDGHKIVANTLTFGAQANRGQGGTPIYGVLIIGEENSPATRPVVLYTPDAPDGLPYRELQNGPKDIDKLLKDPKWREYFSNRMATNNPDEVRSPLDIREWPWRIQNKEEKQKFNLILERRAKGQGGASTAPNLIPLNGNLQDSMYAKRSDFLLAHADYRSTSNAELDRQSTYNKIQFGIDVADFLTGFIPSPKTILSAGRRFVGGAFRRFASQADNIPGLIRKIGKNGKPIVEVGSQLVTPLVSSKISRAPKLAGGLDRLPEGSTPRSNNPGVFDGPPSTSTAYRKIDGQWYEYFVTGTDEHRIRYTDKYGYKQSVQIRQQEGGQWKPDFDAYKGLGGGSVPITPKEIARLTELRAKNQKLLTPSEKKELTNLTKKEADTKKAQDLQDKKLASSINAQKTPAQRITEIQTKIEKDHPEADTLIKTSGLSIDRGRLKNPTNAFYEKPPAVPVPDEDYIKATVWYRAMTAEEFNALKNGQGFQQGVDNGYGGITTSYDYAKSYYVKNDSTQAYLVQFTVDKPLSQYFAGKISQPKLEDGAVSYGLGVQGTPRMPNNNGGETAGEIFNQALQSGNISYDLIGLNIKL